jgi:two-component system cell cycle sensor histidine kinase/response regulator CckA
LNPATQFCGIKNMANLPRRKKLQVTNRLAHLLDPGGRSVQDLIVDGYAPAQMIQDLRKYQSELEIQNQALRYSQQEAEGASERFATLFSSVPLALMVVDEEGLVMASNAMALRLFQPQESDPPLNFLLPFVGADHTDVVAVAFLSAKTHGTSEVSEVGFLSGASGRFTGDLHIARIENPQDDLAHFICAIIDQGPLLAQREELQQSAAVLRQRNEDLLLSENRMAAIINSSLDAILCIDHVQRITVFNPAAMALFQCTEEHALGSPVSIFLPEVAQQLREGHVTSQAVLGEFQAMTLHGQKIFVEISVSLDRRSRVSPASANYEMDRRREQLPQGSITTIFARDLTAKKQAEAQQVLLEGQLRESQKMQAIGTMAGGIAHDFNNILSAILGNVSLATQDLDPGAAALTSLQEIDKAGRRARDLVRQILTFSRNEPPKRIPTYLYEVIEETVRLVKVAMPPSVDLRVTLQPNCPAVLADATQVEQALLNLCTNAFLAVGHEKGSVLIQLSTGQLDASHSERLGVTAGQYAILAVQDSGNGMSALTLERIFEPFFTTRQVGQGTGLGLSVVHGIMQTHQGAVDVQSSLGKGSVFTLYFPTTAQAVAPLAVIPTAPAPIIDSGRGHTVMLVDDDQALVFLVKRVLTRKGYSVISFTDPQAAHAALRANPMGIDLLVTDYNMPGYSGLDLLREAKAMRPDLPVALASGYVTPELEAEALAQGADALIYKPNDVNELCDTVERLILAAASHVR